MSDVLSSEQRSYCMSRIKGSGTTPEVALRRELWNRGLRYRLNLKVAGKPDIAFSKYKLAVFVDGCFWHRCPKHATAPKRNSVFWREKLEQNVARDEQVNIVLASEGWKVLRFWEHEVREDIQACVSAVQGA